jgi:MscS family membrane protein
MNASSSKMCRLSLVVFSSLMAVLILAAVSPLATAAEINIERVDTETQQLTGDQSITYRWAIYNNGNSTFLVRGSVYPAEHNGVSYKFESDSVLLEPGASTFMLVTFKAVREVESAQMMFQVNFTTVRMDDPSQVTVISQPVDISVTSLFGVSAGQNKIFNIWPNTLPAPLNTNIGAFIVSILGWLVIGLLFYFVIDPLVHMATKRTRTELDDIMLRILRMPVFLLIVIIGSVTSLEILHIDPKTLADVETCYHIALIVIGAWISYKIYDEVVLFYAKHFASKSDTELDDVLVPLLEKIGMIFIPIIALMLVFQILGYDVTVLLAGAGFLGIVVGFAAQSTLSNFFAGIQILIDRPFKMGDMLDMNGDFYEVRHIGLRSTELLDTNNNQLVIIPNNDMANNKIVNVVMPNRELTITVVVGVSYGSNVELVKEMMLEAYEELPYSNKNKKPAIRLSDFADSSINMKIFIPIDEATNKWKAASDYREILYRKFNKVGVDIPFPQRVVYLKDERTAK